VKQSANGGRWLDEVKARQRNTLFADTLRNRIGFWQGLYHQKLNTTQRAGFAVLVVFYVTVLIATFYMTWPDGQGSFLEKIYYGYRLQVLICLPVFLILAFLLRRMTRK
jgi:phosphotransferase system  glucose/maltose/N-acetylglucosamine-specific IIC component